MTSKSTKSFRKSQIEMLDGDPQLATVKAAMEIGLSGIDDLSRTELGLLNYLIHAEVKTILAGVIDQAVENRPANIAHLALADTLSSLGTYAATLLAGKALDTIEEPEHAVELARVNQAFRSIQEIAQASLSTSLPPETVAQAVALRAAIDKRVAAGEDPQEALRAAIESGEVTVPQSVKDHLLGKVPTASTDDDPELKTGQYL